ncbi:ribonuclease HII [Betaproteobacteria bacterium]|nr:ribonuclease HII [Betaproteobacteria bacterium]GHU27357.1 ribonuclease HII [Betaproteobacteria bacterium]
MTGAEDSVIPRLICGVDEAGRGPLCGPVVAAAVILDPARPIAGLKDSKKLSAAARERLAVLIRERALAWAVAEASVAEIDRLNILHASMLAMKRAVEALTPAPAEAWVDGNCAPPLNVPVRTLVGGDALEPAISAASILAKTVRDEMMVELDRRYPQFGLARHKGYPTAAHLAAIRTYGIADFYRKSFAPVRALLAQGSLWEAHR